MEKLTKQDIKGPDAFQSSFEAVSHYFFKHRMPILGSLASLLLIGLLWVSYGVYSSNVESKAQEALFTAERTLNTTGDNFEKSKTAGERLDALQKNKSAKSKKALDKKGDDATKAKAAADAKDVAEEKALTEETKLQKPTGNLEADYKDSIPLLKGVIEKYPSSQASVLAALDLTKLYQDHKQYEPQVPLLEKAATVARHPVTKALTLNQLAIAFEGKGDCAKAIKTWQRIEQNKELAFMAGKSLLNMGLCYEKLNQNDKAEQAYLRAEGLVKDGETAKTAKKYLRILKREQKS
jgi:tetratricopeptide (TPR) repeat protein